MLLGIQTATPWSEPPASRSRVASGRASRPQASFAAALRSPRTLLRIQPPVAPPAHARQPGARGPYRRRALRRWRQCPPTVEPRRGRPRIESTGARDVLLPVLEHVDERPADL